MIAFTGNSITASLAASINAGESLVIGRSGKTFSYIIDPSVIKYYASMGFTDTKEIRISLVYS